jgi:hypothetical protein
MKFRAHYRAARHNYSLFATPRAYCATVAYVARFPAVGLNEKAGQMPGLSLSAQLMSRLT